MSAVVGVLTSAVTAHRTPVVADVSNRAPDTGPGDATKVHRGRRSHRSALKAAIDVAMPASYRWSRRSPGRERKAEQLVLLLDRQSPVPLYAQLYGQLGAAIDLGLLKPGDLLESEVSIAARIGLSRGTVRRAYGELVVRGLAVRCRGLGSMVADGVVQAELMDRDAG